MLSGALLTDLFKASDWFDHEFLIAKIYANAFDNNSLYFIHSNLSQRK